MEWATWMIITAIGVCMGWGDDLESVRVFLSCCVSFWVFCFVLLLFASSAYLFFGGLRFAGYGLRIGGVSTRNLEWLKRIWVVLFCGVGMGVGREEMGRNGNEGKGRERKGKDFEIVLITSYLF